MRSSSRTGCAFRTACWTLVFLRGAAAWGAQAPAGALDPQSRPAERSPAMLRALGRAPMRFEVNAGQVRGQGSEKVKFLARGPAYTLFLTGQQVVLKLRSRSQESVRQLTDRSQTSSLQSTAESRQFKSPTDIGSRTTEATFRFSRRSSLATDVVRMTLEGANPNGQVAGMDELPGKSNYFIGNDPKKWRTNVPNYARVKYRSVYPGVDLVFYGNPGQLEYDFVVQPGADPNLIRLAVSAVSERRKKDGDETSPLQIAANGDLVVKTATGEVRFRKPVIHQEQFTVGRSQLTAQDEIRSLNFDARHSSLVTRHFFAGRFVLLAGNDVGIEVAGYDHTQPLIIDPVVSYSTYLGGSGFDYAYGIAVDSSGSAYVTGQTDSLEFPVSDALQKSLGGGTCGTTLDVFPCFDVFVTKLSASGSSVVYSTYLGGSGEDFSKGIALDASGNAYVTGYTDSADFPLLSPFQPNYSGGNCGSAADPVPCFDAFVAKLSSSGSALVYSTYLGGSGQDLAAGVALDAAGEATIVGSTSSRDFPITAGALQTSFAGGTLDAFVTRLDRSGSKAVYSTYLGGGDEDRGQGIAVDAAGNALVTGSTASRDFPTSQALQPAIGGGTCGPLASPVPCTDAFVTQLNTSGTAAVYSTYLGGTGGDAANAIALDASGAAYVAGMTASSDFPVTPGAFQLTGGGTSVSAFAAKIAPQGSSLGYSTYLGGVGQVTANGIAVDSAGNAYLTGFANDASFPVASPTQETSGGFYDAFLTHLNSGGTVVTFSTYLGGSGNDTGQGVAVDEAGNAYLAGGTFSVDFPTQSAFQSLYGGGSFDAFAAKFSALKLSVLALSEPGFTFADQGVSTTSPPQTETLTNTSGAALELSSISASGDFVQTNHCGTTLAPGASCRVQLEFAPTATGNRTGTLTISDDAPDSPQTAALRGNAVVAFSLSATPSDTTVLAGTDSASFVVTAASPFSFKGGVNLTCDVGAPLPSNALSIPRSSFRVARAH